MSTKSVTATQQYPKNSVADMLIILKQADKLSVVKDDSGRPVSAYLDPLNMSIVIVADEV